MYHLFISHSWSYPEAYEGLTKLLNSASRFDYANYSVPESKSLTIYSTRYYRSELWNKIEDKMRSCSVVLVLAGVYASYSDSIQMEVEIAKHLGKPIIAVQPWGAERTSLFVKQNADMVVGWNTSSIVDAIRYLSR